MSAPSTVTALRPARPTIAVDGSDRPGLAEALLSLLVEETSDGLYRCEATFGNWGPKNGGNDFLYFDRQLLEFGKSLKVSLGSDTLFEGRISALEGVFEAGNAPSIAVLAEDRFQDLRMTRRTRTFAQMDDAAVVQQIAGEHGLTPDVSLSGPSHAVLAQLNQSDLAFLRERARALGAEVWVSGTTLSAKPRPSRGTGSPITLTHGGDLREARVIADLAGQRTSVEVGGWDVAAKTALKESAADAALGGELAGADSGATILESAFAARKESLANSVPLTSAEARARAQSAFRQRARRFLVARGVAQTVGGLRVGASVKLERLGPLFSGTFTVTEVRHLFDGADGLRSEFVAERPGLGRP
jgi:phage protein D